MWCCNNTVKMCVMISECQDTLTLPIVSPITDTLKMAYQFAGTVILKDVNVIQGDEIIVPNIFNESYAGLIRFIMPDDTILNDTCYIIDSIVQTDFNPILPPDGGGGGNKAYVFSVNNILPDSLGDVHLNASDVGAQAIAEKGMPNGYAPLGSDGLVPTSFLPSINLSAYQPLSDKQTNISGLVQPNNYPTSQAVKDWVNANFVNGSSGSFIQNQFASAQVASFWISGSGRIGAANSVTSNTILSIRSDSANTCGLISEISATNNGVWAGYFRNIDSATVAIGGGSTVNNIALTAIGGVTKSAENASDYAYYNGATFYRSDLNKQRIGIGGQYYNIATENNVILNQNSISEAKNWAINGNASIQGNVANGLMIRNQGEGPAFSGCWYSNITPRGNFYGYNDGGSGTDSTVYSAANSFVSWRRSTSDPQSFFTSSIQPYNLGNRNSYSVIGTENIVQYSRFAPVARLGGFFAAVTMDGSDYGIAAEFVTKNSDHVSVGQSVDNSAIKVYGQFDSDATGGIHSAIYAKSTNLGNAPVHAIYSDGGLNYFKGSITAQTLSGTGTRMVVADANGLLSTQAIPSGGGGSADPAIVIMNQFSAPQAAEFWINGRARFDNVTLYQYQSGSTPEDAVKFTNNGNGATIGIQNNNATGFAGVEYFGSDGNMKVFTGYNNNASGEFRFNDIVSGGIIRFMGVPIQVVNLSADGAIWNGAMLYRTDTNKQRVCINGAYQNIATENNVILNQNASAQTANFWISGDAIIGSTLKIGSAIDLGFVTPLQVISDVDADTTALFQCNYSGGKSSIYFADNNGTINLQIGTWNTTSSPYPSKSFIVSQVVDLYFSANGGSNIHAALRTNGNFLIGTTTDNNAKLQINGDVTTSQPSANGVGKWKLGKLVTTTVAANTTRYIEISVDGVVYKLMTAT